MARKKQQGSEPRKALELLISKEEAESKLRERISKGQVIRDLKISSQQGLDTTRKEYDKWNSYNSELLKRLFSSNELEEEYSAFFGFVGIGGSPQPIHEKISEFHEDVSDHIGRIDSIIERLELIPLSARQTLSAVSKPSQDTAKTEVFIVHGHDDAAKLEVARFIEKIGFKPIILHEQASESKTIIEKIEAHTDVGFGVVIYSPCDLGAKNSENPSLKGRARQNVVFEHGFLIGKLGRENVCPLVKGDVETPNDISGIVYTSMDAGSWKIDLAKELRSAGYAVDMNKVIE